jgi:predicted GIY-YIG superfamily endonuclease
MIITNIYILKLVDNKYYIGFTDNIKKRVQEHIDGNGSSFTKMYRPINLVKVYENVNPEKVDVSIIKYMKKFGVDNVRGGSYKNAKLKKSQIKELKKQGIIFPKISIDDINLDDLILDDIEESNVKIQKVLKIPVRQANGTCFNCMKDGHYVHQCRETIDKYGNRIKEEEVNELDEFYKYNPMA